MSHTGLQANELVASSGQEQSSSLSVKCLSVKSCSLTPQCADAAVILEGVLAINVDLARLCIWWVVTGANCGLQR
jgi:hypothetical protein